MKDTELDAILAEFHYGLVGSGMAQEQGDKEVMLSRLNEAIDQAKSSLQQWRDRQVAAELESVLEQGYDDMSKTYSPDHIFRALRDRQHQLKHKEHTFTPGRGSQVYCSCGLLFGTGAEALEHKQEQG